MKTTPSVKYLLATIATACALTAGNALAQPKPTEVDYYIPPLSSGAVNPNPFLAGGVGIGRNVDVYFSAGIGPSALNTCSPSGTPARYIDYSFYPGFTCGDLPLGVTVTEAQGMNNLARIKENLEANGLTLRDVTYLRIYLEAPPGETRADYAGWNRAYRKFFANVNLVTGEVIPAYAPVVVVNATRPARANVQVATLPVLGWLVEIEAVAAYPQGSRPR